MESFLNVLISKNVLIIEVLIGTILLLALVAGYRWFVAKPAKEVSGGVAISGGTDLKELEETLKKVLEKAGAMQPMMMPATGEMSESDMAALTASQEQIRRLTAEIGNLKSELGNKQKMMEDLSAKAASSGASAGEGLSSGEKTELESQIKELQGKLSEYEIISEDITDLSFYKEQTAKLQREIEELKANLSKAPPASAPTPPPPKVEPEIKGSAKATEAAKEGPIVPELDEDILADFAAAVEDQKAAKAAASAAPAPEAPVAEEVDLGSLDMDKMLNEAAGINSDDVPEISAEQALGTGLDENKILKEASAMDTAVSEEDKNLMGQFENFVKANDKD